MTQSLRFEKVVWLAQEKNEALRAAASAASKGGSASEARLHDREQYISSLQVRALPQDGYIVRKYHTGGWSLFLAQVSTTVVGEIFGCCAMVHVHCMIWQV